MPPSMVGRGVPAPFMYSMGSVKGPFEVATYTYCICIYVYIYAYMNMYWLYVYDLLDIMYHICIYIYIYMCIRRDPNDGIFC